MCLVILSYKFDTRILKQFYSDKMQTFCTLVYFLVIFFFHLRDLLQMGLCKLICITCTCSMKNLNFTENTFPKILLDLI